MLGIAGTEHTTHAAGICFAFHLLVSLLHSVNFAEGKFKTAVVCHRELT